MKEMERVEFIIIIIWFNRIEIELANSEWNEEKEKEKRKKPFGSHIVNENSYRFSTFHSSIW